MSMLTGHQGFIGPLDELTVAELAKVQAWMDAYGRASVPVLTGAAPDPADFEEGEEVVDDREVEFTHAGAFLSGAPGDTGRRAVLRIGWSWRVVPVGQVEVHPRYAEAASLPQLDDYEQLDFPPPDCTYCEVGLQHDGDGWVCEHCEATWTSDGTRVTRKCVEPDCDADQAVTIGEDGQPRCRTCAFQILIGAIEATPPYECRKCHATVTGMPFEAAAHRNGRLLCGRCNQREESDRWFRDYMAGKGTPVSTVGSL